jgi:hypothetical protein
VIRIRYSTELQPGLNGQAERVGRTTVVYLLPGLTAAQRAAALRRLRQHGRMGISPPLPAAQLLLALLGLRIRTAFGQVGAIVRVHPAGSALPVMVLSGALAAFLVLPAVHIRVVHQPEAIGSGLFGIGPIAGSGANPSPSGGQNGHPTSSPGQGIGDASGAGGGGGAGSGPGTGGGSGGSGGTAQSSTAATAPPGAGTSPSPNPAPTVPGAAPNAPSPATSTSPASSPASSGGSTTSVCVGLGSLGLCLNL